MNNIAIKVSHLTKVYKLYDKPIDRLKESLHPLKKSYHKDFYALNDVNLEIKKGETVGIIGKNGAGKSTLLKIITGVLTPSSGHVHVNGRISSLLELGAGFNPEYTGIENIYLQGTLIGYSHSEMESKIDEILEFADIGDFVHQPVKMYSSGMFARLAFAVAINVEPDILIVDEALSVGDAKFQNKCLTRIKYMQEKGVTVLLVTHSTAQINSICTFAIWINDGKVIEFGDTLHVTSLYTYDQNSILRDSINVTEKNDSLEENELITNLEIEKLYDDNSIILKGFNVFNSKKSYLTTLSNADSCKLLVKLQTKKIITSPLIGFGIYNYLDEAIVHFNSENLNIKNQTININEIFIVEIDFDIPYLNSGEYIIKFGIDSGTLGANEKLYHIVLSKFEFISKKKQNGYFIVNSNIRIEHIV
jgi:ABC-type polysaccharide/polyol phosphate transport system ATPase subunit